MQHVGWPKTAIVIAPNVPPKQAPRLTKNKEYNATHIARDLYLIKDNKGEGMTITVGSRGCHHISHFKWKIVG